MLKIGRRRRHFLPHHSIQFKKKRRKRCKRSKKALPKCIGNHGYSTNCKSNKIKSDRKRGPKGRTAKMLLARINWEPRKRSAHPKAVRTPIYRLKALKEISREVKREKGEE